MLASFDVVASRWIVLLWFFISRIAVHLRPRLLPRLSFLSAYTRTEVSSAFDSTSTGQGHHDSNMLWLPLATIAQHDTSPRCRVELFLRCAGLKHQCGSMCDCLFSWKCRLSRSSVPALDGLLLSVTTDAGTARIAVCCSRVEIIKTDVHVDRVSLLLLALVLLIPAPLLPMSRIHLRSKTQAPILEVLQPPVIVELGQPPN